MKKLIAMLLILTLTLCVGLTACGKKDETKDNNKASASGEPAETEPAAPEVKGEVKTLGGFSVLVPEGFEAEANGSLADLILTDPNNTNSPAYFYIDADTAENAFGSLDTTKEMNESYNPADVPEFTTGENIWQGVTYSGGSWTVCQLACAKGDDGIVVRMCGYDLQSPEVQAILASLAIAAE